MESSLLLLYLIIGIESATKAWSWRFWPSRIQGQSPVGPNTVKKAVALPKTIVRTRKPGYHKRQLTAILTQLIVDKCPLGYPRLATFLSSDRSFMQYRGFGSLHSRVLLGQQYDIEKLEQELDKLDQWDQDRSEPGSDQASELRCKALDDQASRKDKMPQDFPYRRTRPEVLGELKHQLMEYGEHSGHGNSVESYLSTARHIASEGSRSFRYATSVQARLAQRPKLDSCPCSVGRW